MEIKSATRPYRLQVSWSYPRVISQHVYSVSICIRMMLCSLPFPIIYTWYIGFALPLPVPPFIINNSRNSHPGRQRTGSSRPSLHGSCYHCYRHKKDNSRVCSVWSTRVGFRLRDFIMNPCRQINDGNINKKHRTFRASSLPTHRISAAIRS